jgi:endonuclease/exonuclease/phosphatase family metal-dependent hydrolase
MTFNLRFDNGGPNSSADVNGWLLPENPRRERALSVLSEQNPDLVGLQEVLSNQVDDLVAARADYEFFGVGRDDGVRAGEFAGMLFRRARFERIAGGHFWLSETPEVAGTVFPGSGSIRMVSWLRLHDRNVGRSFVWLNTHWDNASAASREQSASLIRERLPALAAASPILLTGDLNATETSTAVRTLIAGPPRLIDGYRQALPAAAADELTFHGFQGTTLGSRIDFILHGPELVTRDAAIVRTSFQGRYPSDHYPVVATLEWAEAELPENPPLPGATSPVLSKRLVLDLDDIVPKLEPGAQSLDNLGGYGVRPRAALWRNEPAAHHR